MALITCKDCQKEYSNAAEKCPSCGRPSDKSASTQAVSAVLTFIILGALGWYFYGGGLEQQASSDLSRIEAQVAEDQVQQYYTAKRGGSAMDACVQAGMVAAAYLQANNSEKYSLWKQTEKGDCAAAGLSR